MGNKPGYVSFRYNPETETMYISGRKVQGKVSRSEAYYYQEKINAMNQNLGVPQYKTTLIEKNGMLQKSLIMETKKEAIARNKREASKLRDRLIGSTAESRLLKEANLLSKMPDIVQTMEKYLQNPEGMNPQLLQELEKFRKTYESMTDAQRQQFYRSNPELFEDMTDYYNWLKEHSGRSAGNEPSAWMKNRGIKTSKGVDTKLLRKLKSINKIADRIVNPVTYARGRMD